MAVPPKRKSNRSLRRAGQRAPGETTEPEPVEPEPSPAIVVASGVPLDTGGDAAKWIAAPPRGGCAPWHYYWCDGHDDWHHHTAPAIAAIEASLPQP